MRFGSPEQGFRESPEPERWSGPEKVYFPDKEGRVGEWGVSFLAKDFVKLVKVSEGGKLEYLEAPRSEVERAAKVSQVLEFIQKYGGAFSWSGEKDSWEGEKKELKDAIRGIINSRPEFGVKKPLKTLDSLLLEMEIGKVDKKIEQKEDELHELNEEIRKYDVPSSKEIVEKREEVLEEIGEFKNKLKNFGEAAKVLKALEDIR